MDKIIIESRINENRLRDVNPNLPYSPAEIAEAAGSCYDAGAAIVHYHSRATDGSPVHAAESFCITNRLIRQRCPILIHPTLGADSNERIGASRFDAVETMMRKPETRVDIVPMDMGTVTVDTWDADARRHNSLDKTYHNETGTLMHFATRSQDLGLTPQLQLWNGSFTRQAIAFVEAGLVRAPAYVNLVMTEGGVIAAHPGTTAGLDAHLALLPDDGRFVWTTMLYGGDLLKLAGKIIDAGGHIAIGIGDHPYAEYGTPENAWLVDRVVEMARSRGREPASVAETQEILGMTHVPVGRT